MTMATAFKPEYIELADLGPATMSACLSPALDDAGCTDKQIDFKAHRILAKAVYGDYKILCWWAAEQEDVSDGKPMLTVDKGTATLLGICAFPRSGKSGDSEAIARLNSRVREKIEHYLKAGNLPKPEGGQDLGMSQNP
jgi:hypothetical protein